MSSLQLERKPDAVSPPIQRLVYETTLEDMVTFSLHHHGRSSLGRRGPWIRAVFVLGITWYAYFVAEMVRVDLPTRVAIAVGTLVLLLILLSLRQRNMRRLFRRLYAEPGCQTLIGPRELEIHDEGLVARSDYNDNLLYWNGIQRVERTPSHTFIYISSVSALIVPHHLVLEGSPDDFADAVRKRCAAPALP